MMVSWAFLLLLLCGDIESNPGPPRRAPGGGKTEAKKEEAPKEGQVEVLEKKVYINLSLNKKIKISNFYNYLIVITSKVIKLLNIKLF